MLPLLAVYMLCACAGVCVLVCVCLSVGPPTRQLAVAYVDLTSTGRYDLGPQSVLVMRDRPVREIYEKPFCCHFAIAAVSLAQAYGLCKLL